MQNIRRTLSRLMEENADPVGLLEEMKKLFVRYAESAELDDTARRAYCDAAQHIDTAQTEFTRRGIR